MNGARHTVPTGPSPGVHPQIHRAFVGNKKPLGIGEPRFNPTVHAHQETQV